MKTHISRHSHCRQVGTSSNDEKIIFFTASDDEQNYPDVENYMDELQAPAEKWVQDFPTPSAKVHLVDNYLMFVLCDFMWN